jgi:hypothetical protein
MYDRRDKPKAGTSAAQVERRAAGRHPFIAAAEVVEVGSTAVFSTRTTDLGPGGCFVDTLVPFSPGTRVHLTVREGQTDFAATGTVVYSQAGLGMGIAFDDLRPEQKRALALWLGEEIGDRDHEATTNTAGATSSTLKAMLPHGSDRQALVRLVRMMVDKGMLSEAEGAAIFGNPVLF